MTHGTPSPVFLQQLPRYNSMQLSNAPDVKQVLRAAFASGDGEASATMRMKGRQMLGGRLFNLVRQPFGP